MSNVQVNQPTTLGAVIATDKLDTVDHQLVKVEFGDPGSATQVSSSNPLPSSDSTAQGTLASILAKIIAAPATAANQATIISSLTSLLNELTQKTEPSDQQHTIVDSSALPSGAATSGNQTTANNSLSSIDGKITAVNTGAVVVSSSALPSGAATGTKQDTGNTSLSSIDTKVATAANQATEITSLSSIKTNSDPLVASGGGGYVRQDSTATIAKETGGNLATVKTNTDPLVTAAGGGYVRQDSTATIAKESGGNLATLVTTVSTSAKQDTGNTSIASVDTKMSTLLTQTDGIEASLTSIDAGTPAALGQTTMSASQPVVLASDQTGIPVSSIIPGTGATNLGKAEDAPHTTGDVGVMALTVRNDSGSVLAGNDGDYVPLTTDSTGALRIDMNGTLSTNNSSIAALLGSAIFTGTSEDVLNYNELVITIYSDANSATDGLSIQQSTDNSNWVIADVYTITGGVGKTISVPRQARYFRVVYSNGTIAQATFILQTILNRVGTKSSSQRASDNYTNQTDLEQDQSFLMNYDNASGTWSRVRGDVTNGILVNPNGFNTEYQRRLQEQVVLEMYENSYRNLFNSECYTSGRNGFELR